LHVEVENRHFRLAYCVLVVDHRGGNAQQYRCNLYIAEKYIQCATIL